MTAYWTALAFRSSKEHISSADDLLSTGQAISISNVTNILFLFSAPADSVG